MTWRFHRRPRPELPDSARRAELLRLARPPLQLATRLSDEPNALLVSQDVWVHLGGAVVTHRGHRTRER